MKNGILTLTALALLSIPAIGMAENFTMDLTTMLNIFNSGTLSGYPLIGSDRNGPLGNTNNEIVDADEFAVIKSILDDPEHPYYAQVNAAFTTNLNAVYTLVTASADWVTTIAAVWPGGSARTFSELMAGFATLGDNDSKAWARQQLATYPVQLGFTTVQLVDANVATWNTSLANLLSYSGDLDGDGSTNLEEYPNAYSALSPALRARLDAGIPDEDLTPAELQELSLFRAAYVVLANDGLYIADPEADSDSDGLPDTVETNTGVYLGLHDTGTDPDNPDTDGDGYRDDIEAKLFPLLNPLAADAPDQVPAASAFGLVSAAMAAALAAVRRLRKIG